MKLLQRTDREEASAFPVPENRTQRLLLPYSALFTMSKEQLADIRSSAEVLSFDDGFF